MNIRKELESLSFLKKSYLNELYLDNINSTIIELKSEIKKILNNLF